MQISTDKVNYTVLKSYQHYDLLYRTKSQNKRLRNMHRSVLQRTFQQNKTIGIRGDYKVYTFFFITVL